ncbi:MAG: hypothetical protein M0P47_09255 [Bacteroidales bacterium]|nr:hypothetical protein [Bacteroidales bacterium]
MKIPRLSIEAERLMRETLVKIGRGDVNYTVMYRAGYNHARRLAKKAKDTDLIITERELVERVKKLEEGLGVLRGATEGTRMSNRDGIKALNDKYAYMMTKLREMEKLLLPENQKKEDICL